MSAHSPRPLTLAQIADSIPGARGAARLSPATLTRWIITGCVSRSGVRVRLAATRCGQRWLVYQSDLDTFFAALAGDLEQSATTAPVKATTRKGASEAAGRKLAAMGA